MRTLAILAVKDQDWVVLWPMGVARSISEMSFEMQTAGPTVEPWSIGVFEPLRRPAPADRESGDRINGSVVGPIVRVEAALVAAEAARAGGVCRRG